MRARRRVDISRTAGESGEQKGRPNTISLLFFKPNINVLNRLRQCMLCVRRQVGGA